MTMENKYSPLPTWRLLTLLPPRISLISKRKPAREGRLLSLYLLRRKPARESRLLPSLPTIKTLHIWKTFNC